MGELPVACLAEEIDTPGEGQIRALVTVAGNPVLSTPNSARLDAGMADLECYVAVDIYLNETTRHADVILPPPSSLQKGHYDLALLQVAIRNVANYSPPVLPLDEGQPDEWEILARLALIAQGMGADADPNVVDDLVVGALVSSAVGDEHGPVHGREPDDVLAALAPRRGPERLLDLLVRTGPYGDGFGARTDEVAPGCHRCRSTSCWLARTASTSGLSSLACPTCCARRAAWSKRPRSRSSPTWTACAPSWTARCPRRCSWVDGICAPTTRGCTTSRCW